MSTSQQKSDGTWGPACPLPFYHGWRALRKVECECKRRFWTEKQYRQHWHEAHEPELLRSARTYNQAHVDFLHGLDYW